MSETFISKWVGQRWPQYCDRTLNCPVPLATPHSEMFFSGKLHFLEKKVLVTGVEDLEMLSIRNLLKQFSQCIKMTWVKIFWGLFEDSQDYLVTAIVVCYWVICRLHSSWDLQCLTLLAFVWTDLYSTNFIRVSRQDAIAVLAWGPGPHACLHAESPKPDVSVAKESVLQLRILEHFMSCCKLISESRRGQGWAMH